MARGKCRQGKAGGMAPAAGMLMEVRRLLDEGAFRAPVPSVSVPVRRIAAGSA